MLFETIGQIWFFLLLIWFGIVSGLIDEIGKFLNTHLTKKITTKKANHTKIKNAKKNSTWHLQILLFVADFIRVIIASGIFYLSSIFYNYGDIRLYSILAFAGGFILERKVFTYLIAKIILAIKNKLQKKATKQVSS